MLGELQPVRADSVDRPRQAESSQVDDPDSSAVTGYSLQDVAQADPPGDGMSSLRWPGGPAEH